AAPNNGTAHARCFRFGACFARDMVKSSHTLQMLDRSIVRVNAIVLRANAIDMRQVPLKRSNKKAAQGNAERHGLMSFT
ncbi:MAG: hypothetical protein WBW37_15885, partial [Methyloceanibacter sp.]